jgi:hypothetical protein
MPRVNDDVRVESVTAHRKRLRQAFLLGRLDQRRDIDNGIGAVIASIVIAAVACAGCVGFSFVSEALAQSSTPAPSPAASGPAASPRATPTAAPSRVAPTAAPSRATPTAAETGRR